MIHVLVTGADGQLGQCLKNAAPGYPGLRFTYTDRAELDITKPEEVLKFFQNQAFDYCINAAAYTNVEKAESEEALARMINEEGSKNIAIACEVHDCVLIHISTDYVFDGKSSRPYIEEDPTNPIQAYGESKLAGEERIREVWEKHFIIRTSWLYSEHGGNFLNFILKRLTDGEAVSITTEQTGSPTNANDLANAILHIISLKSQAYGTYHFSNTGSTTWYGLAMAISEIRSDLGTGLIEKTDYYRTFAERPKLSVLNTDKFEMAFSYKPLPWKESLKLLLGQA